MIARRIGGVVPVFPQMALCAAFACVASVTLLTISLAERRLLLGVLTAISFVICFVLSGNQRLFSLWGLLLTAPLSLTKAFWVSLHMGGADSISIDAEDVFLVLLLAFIVRDVVQGRAKPRFSGIAFFWGGLILLGVINVITGPYRHLPLVQVVLMLKHYVLFFVILNEVVRVRQFLHAFAALAVGVGMQAVIGIIQWTFALNLGLQVLGEADPEITKSTSDFAFNYAGSAGVFRISALIYHPNAFSAYLALLLPVCFALLFSRISVIAKVLIAIVISLAGPALVMTLSRSGWFAFAVGFSVLMVIAFVHPRLRTRYLMARLAVIALIVVLMAALSGPIYRRVFESDPGSATFRYELIDGAIKMWQDHPIMGAGLNTFVANMPGYTKYGGPRGLTKRYGKFWPVVHSTWMIVLTEQGAIGFALFVAMHIYILWVAFRNACVFTDDVVFTVSLGCAAGVLAIMADGIASFFLRVPPGRMFWVAVALIFAAKYWNEANRPVPKAAETQPGTPPQYAGAANDGE